MTWNRIDDAPANMLVYHDDVAVMKTSANGICERDLN